MIMNPTMQLCTKVPSGIKVQETAKVPTSPRGRTRYPAASTKVLRGGGNKMLYNLMNLCYTNS